MEKTIGVGVIGIGQGQDLLQLNSNPNTRLQVRALCSATEAKVSALAEAQGIGFWTTDYQELVARDDIEVVGVYSPDHLHGEHCLAALEAGKHVIVTKPLVGRARGEGIMEELRAIVNACREHERKLLVGHTMRFCSEFRAAKTTLDDGDLGDILVAEAHYVHDLREVFELTPWRLTVPQDFMFGGCGHPIDALRWLLGDVEEVHCLAGEAGDLLEEYPIESNFLINLKFKSGVIGRVMGLYGIVEPPMPLMGVSLYGSRASMRSDFTDFKAGHVRVIFDKLDRKPELNAELPAIMQGPYGQGRAVREYCLHFEQCITEDLRPDPDEIEGAKTIATAWAAWESALSGEPVKVPDEF